MRKLLALGGRKNLCTVKEKLGEADLDMTVAQFYDIEINISNNALEISVNGQDLRWFDYVWLTSSWNTRTIAFTVSLFLFQNNIRSNKVEVEKSKLVDMATLALKGVKVPDTYYCSTRNLQENLSSIQEFCGFPFVIKPTKGSLGKDIHLVTSNTEFLKIISELKDSKSYICQRFIPNKFDYRVIVGNGKVVSVCQRVRQEDHFRNNTYLGAKENFIGKTELNKSITNLAIDATNALNLTWSGVDIVSSTETGEDYVLEINRRPGFTADSTEVSAAFEYILSLGI